MRLLPFFLLTLLMASAFAGPKHAAAEKKTADTISATDSILRYWLKERIVTNDAPVKGTFWLWMDGRELDTVAQQHSLFRHSVPQNALESFYQQELFNKKWNRHPLALLLRETNFLRKHEAWNTYWGNLSEGIEYHPDENQLVKVVLEDSALIVAFLPHSKNPWQVYELSGRPVLLPEALKRKQQIAAIYICDDANVKIGCPTGTFMSQEEMQLRYRAFMLCNEKMIKSWHHAVPGMQDQLVNELNYLLLLHAYFTAHPETITKKQIAQSWEKKDENSVRDLFHASLRVAMKNTEADSLSTRQIIDQLRERWPKQKNPVEKFPSKGLR